VRALKITQSITRRDQKSLEKYLAEISRYDVLTPEQEVELFRRIENGDETAIDKIVRHNLRFVVSVAKQYQHLGLWLGDLVNEGNIGLMKAARRFDVSRGFKFISYAVWWIRQAILQAINEKALKIRVPGNLKNINSKVREARSRFLQEFEREPTTDELAEITEISPSQIEKSIETYRKCSSLDAPLTSESDDTLVAVLEDNNMRKPDHNLAVRHTQQTEVKQLLDLLPPRQAKVLSMYYGIGQKRAYSLDDISDLLGVSRERTRQIRDKGIRRLRVRARDMQPTLS
jgi:RNA polymerase primary sigma factor